MFVAGESVRQLLVCLLKNELCLLFDFTDWDWERQIQKACCSTILRLSTSTNCEVRVAQVTVQMDQIVENVADVIGNIANAVPNSWGNIDSLCLRMGSHRFSIYQSVPDEQFD